MFKDELGSAKYLSQSRFHTIFNPVQLKFVLSLAKHLKFYILQPGSWKSAILRDAYHPQRAIANSVLRHRPSAASSLLIKTKKKHFPMFSHSNMLPTFLCSSTHLLYGPPLPCFKLLNILILLIKNIRYIKHSIIFIMYSTIS